MSDILNVLHDLKERITVQIEQFDAGMITIADGSSQPLAAQTRYQQLLHAQLTDVEDAILMIFEASSFRSIKHLN
jgi:hypothetical protein